MHILLVQPPYYTEQNRGLPHFSYSDPCLGMTDLAAYLLSHGYEVSFKDLYTYKWDDLPVYLEPFRKYGHELIVGINCYSDTRQSTYQMARLIKSLIPTATVVIGGIHASFFSDDIMKKEKAIDYVVVGEGERSLLAIVKAVEHRQNLQQDVKGITFRDGDKIIFNGYPDVIVDLDELPMTAHHLFDFDDFGYSSETTQLKSSFEKLIPKAEIDKMRIWSMNTSRGCPGRCSFCTGGTYMKRWRWRSGKKVVDEMEMLKGTYGFNVLQIFDNCFTTNKKRVIEICNELLTRKLNIYWRCLARVDTVDKEMLQLMREAGCVSIAYGIESGSPVILENINKRTKLDKMYQACEETARVGIKVGAFLVVGNYGESDKTMNETLQFIKKAKIDTISAGQNIVYPGTKLYELCKQKGWLTDDYWDSYQYAPYFTFEHSKEKLIYWTNKLKLDFGVKNLKYDKHLGNIKFLSKLAIRNLLYKLKLLPLLDFARDIVKGQRKHVRDGV